MKNNATLAGTGVISGAVTAEAGSHLAPGVNTRGADGAKRGRFGAAGTLRTGALTLDKNANLAFDLAATTEGASDRIVTRDGNLSFSSLNVTFHGLAHDTLQTAVPYHLIQVGAGSISGDPGAIATSFAPGLAGRYTATYAINTVEGDNRLDVVFTATALSAPAESDADVKNAPRPESSSKRKWGVKS